MGDRIITVAESTNTGWGCAAVGRCGDASIDLDEAISVPDRWELTIELSRFYLRFAVPGPSVVTQLRKFLDRYVNQTTSGELSLGTLGSANVVIVKDDECLDRFWLRVLADDGAVDQTLLGDVVSDLIGAVQQAEADLDH